MKPNSEEEEEEEEEQGEQAGAEDTEEPENDEEEENGEGDEQWLRWEESMVTERTANREVVLAEQDEAEWMKREILSDGTGNGGNQEKGKDKPNRRKHRGRKRTKSIAQQGNSVFIEQKSTTRNFPAKNNRAQG